MTDTAVVMICDLESGQLNAEVLREHLTPDGRSEIILEVVSKPHLRLNGCVVPQIEILTY